MDGRFRAATASANSAAELWDRVRVHLGGDPSLVIVAMRATPAAWAEARAFGMRAAECGCACLGATTALGALHADGPQHNALAAFAIRDPQGAFGVALAGNVAEAVDAACRSAGRPGEKPAAVIALVTPGEEESLVGEIVAELGEDVPVIGGGAADDEVAGQWRVLAGDTVSSRGAALATLFPGIPVETAFISGYAPAGPTAVATRVEGRTLLEIDGEPAARVYARWLGTDLVELTDRREILAATTFAPLGMRVGTLAGAPLHVLMHPAGITREEGIELFAAPREGAGISLMRADAGDVLARPALAVEGALARRGWDPGSLHGAWFAFCAGCAFGVRERIEEAAGQLKAVLGDAPFQLFFTFGELGCFVDGRSRHGNLMVSMLLFGPA